MAYEINNNIEVNTNKPLDAKILVGTGQEYGDIDNIPTDNLSAGMKCTEVSTKTTYVWTGSSWVNESFGINIIAVVQGTPSVNAYNNLNNTVSVQVNKLITFYAIPFGNVKKIEWTLDIEGSPQTASISTVTYTPTTASDKSCTVKVTNYFDETVTKNFTIDVDTIPDSQSFLYGFEDDLSIYGVNVSSFAHATLNSAKYNSTSYEVQPTEVIINYYDSFESSVNKRGYPWFAYPAAWEDYATWATNGFTMPITSGNGQATSIEDRVLGQTNFISDIVTYGDADYIFMKTFDNSIEFENEPYLNINSLTEDVTLET